MKSSNAFKKVIQEHLEQLAKDDELFAVTYAKEGKNIDDCVTYIINTVKKKGVAALTADEVFSMAIHYYDEDNIEIGKSTSCEVVSNHFVGMGVNDKRQDKETPKKTKGKQIKPESNVTQLTLF